MNDVSNIRFFALLLIVGFPVNLVWENLHATLYAGYQGIQQFWWLCFTMSVKDVGWIILLYGVVVVARRDILWISKRTLVDICVVIGLGTLLAVSVESHALITGRWAYGPYMPLIPFTQIGLTPVLQMMILPIMSMLIAEKMSRKNKHI